MSAVWLVCLALAAAVLATVYGLIPLPLEQVAGVVTAVVAFLLICGFEARTTS
ncbi:hypothetical protein QNA08_12955 [Chelatococcus sp. SYSU_G07232]|uniref:DUF4040 domain-containing protein n=1 Tax=Chelatococcus albus TaxID=3047466 RepID=A0ABT7AID8_9HYPH|nr:hypothetical protein [Chelatococcus sp. SYSU_G07232]MDJ1159147.1 hypothetical protein [Chelatococcus sp. SYSU_G07232]